MTIMELNEIWEQRIKDLGADFVRFVDASALPVNDIDGYTCAVLFGKILSREYISTLRAGEKTKRQEFSIMERKMGILASKLADLLEIDGYKSVCKLKFARLPHKTVALRAGLGFIGKNNLLVNDQYGCALVLGKVLTTAPFVATNHSPKEPQCGNCSACVDVCPTKALHGKTWSITTKRDEIMVRKLCTCCLQCMIWCPYTEAYAKGECKAKSTFAAQICLFERDKGWHYVSVPLELSKPLEYLADRGLIAVTVTIGASSWQTSMLPMGDGTHFIALPAKVRQKEKLSLGQPVEISFEIRRKNKRGE